MPSKYDENTKARAVRLVREHADDYESEWAAMRAIWTRLGIVHRDGRFRSIRPSSVFCFPDNSGHSRGSLAQGRGGVVAVVGNY
jgi:hypothetical protein